ncbi:MAG TPA: IscS subfamily cysteine desulfurase [Gammaproteobacteria bacterium]|nr:IscS subfamily cysteine desulfurase [Gammaproteobacteria bacterium]
MKLPIYMDNHATTQVDPRVIETMLPFFTEKFGNASSRNHVFGWDSEAAVDRAREQVASLIHAASPREIVFTSGATESDNIAIKGIAEAYAQTGNHIVTCAIEHKAVLDSCKSLERKGYRVTYLPVRANGLINLDEVRDALTDKTVLISIMAANNEIGTIQPVRDIGQIAKEKGILFHTDATQAVGKIPVNVEDMGIDLLSLTAHKIYGPKGIGALYVRSSKPRVKLSPLIEGGGQERGLRSGTLNVPGIVGLGKACEIAQQDLMADGERLTGLSQRLRTQIVGQLDEVSVNGDPLQRLPGNLHLSFAYIEGESLLMALKDIAVSTGSACTSASLEPSHVLRAIGLEEHLAHSSIRFGLGRFNTEEEVDYTAHRVVEEVHRLRGLSPILRARKARLQSQTANQKPQESAS